MLSKEQVIAAIQEFNRTAKSEWLAMFDLAALKHYLNHLEQAQEPRGGHSFWIRTYETPAITTREPAG